MDLEFQGTIKQFSPCVRDQPWAAYWWPWQHSNDQCLCGHILWRRSMSQLPVSCQPCIYKAELEAVGGLQNPLWGYGVEVGRSRDRELIRRSRCPAERTDAKQRGVTVARRRDEVWNIIEISGSENRVPVVEGRNTGIENNSAEESRYQRSRWRCWWAEVKGFGWVGQKGRG
jgi:hypothetical protein